MRILFISQMIPYLPCYDGFRLVPANLIRELSRRHEIHLIAFRNGLESTSQLNWVKPYCRSVTFLGGPILPTNTSKLFSLCGYLLDRRFQRLLWQTLRAVGPDALHVEGAILAPCFSWVPKELPKVVSIHDSLSLRLREFARYATTRAKRALFLAQAFLASWYEKRWLRFADFVVVTSDRDREAVLGAVGEYQVRVIPNGVDLNYFLYKPEPKVGRIVFSGNMAWPPNEDAAEFFACEIFPRVRAQFPQSKFVVVGANPSNRVLRLSSLPGVEITGTVPDIRPWLWEAAVYVSPLRFGMGVKNKILEAMALGAPIAATSRSLSGTPLSHGTELLVADDAGELRDSVITLLKDRSLANSLSRRARSRVEREYSWSAIAAKFEALYHGANPVL